MTIARISWVEKCTVMGCGKANKCKRPPCGGPDAEVLSYSVDSISKPQAAKSGSGMYFEFLFLRAHSRRRVERRYWSGRSLNSFTACSNDVTTGTTGPMGSGFPQFGFPRRLAMISTCLYYDQLFRLLANPSGFR